MQKATIPPVPDNAWRLIAVFDTDDGPRAWWVRPIQTIDCTGCAVADGTHKPAQYLHQIAEQAAQGLDVQQYRLIDHGELIEADDEFLLDDFTWEINPNGIFVSVHRKT